MNEQLNDLKKKEADLQTAITEKASLVGQQTQLLKTLQERFGCDTLAKAQALIETKNAELIDYQTAIEKLQTKIDLAMVEVKGVQ